MESLIKGIILGFSIAAPVGPIGLLCIRTTLSQGRAFGFVSGLGAATADAMYGTLAALGLTVISHFLIQQSAWINLVGALFLIYLAYRTFGAPAASADEQKDAGIKGSYLRTFGTTLLLTLTNPLTIVSFAGIFAGMNIGPASESSVQLVLGVFLGSALWWLFLSGTVGLLQRMISSRLMKRINTLSALVLLGFGVYSLYRTFKGLY
ncbi:LysE family translocator [Cohnella boryungensis]|uniref:LysE family translocator n=1 Tax=Cohnella boryungensis TaxID=768479 RepID=A0ABV8SLI5_9BACL